MAPFSPLPIQPIDYRYPGSFGLNRSAELPQQFGPPNMAQLFQSSIAGLAAPLVKGMEAAQNRADTATSAAEGLKVLEKLYAPEAAGTTSSTGTSSPARASSTTAGSPTGEAGGVMGGGVASSEVRDTFMNTVKAGGLTNPYGLAAVAATGQAETAWSPGRLTTAWNDLGKPSGGAMSWRAERLQAMRNFTRGSDNPAAAQAQFFLNEDPALIERLNQARSPEEANALMARAWRYKGYDGGPEYAKREALTKQYVGRMGEAAPAPAPAPQAGFAPTVAPAPSPEAQAAVAASQGPQLAPNIMDARTGRPMSPNDPALAPLRQGAQQPAAGQRQASQQVQAAQQQADPQQQAQAQQAQIVGNVAQEDQQAEARLEQTRQAGRTQVASLNPSAGISPPLPGLNLGAAVPTGGSTAGLAPPRAVPTTREPLPPDVVPPSTIDTPTAALPSPAAPPTTAPPVVPSAPVGPSVPPSAPAGVPPSAPVRIAQATGLPPAIGAQQRGGIDRATAEFLLRNARSPEEVSKIIGAVAASRQAPETKGNRFDLKHDANGNWYRVDQLTGAVSPVPTTPGAGYRELTADEKKKFGIPENTGAFMGPDGKPHVLPGTASTKITVSPEAKGEEKFQEETAKSVRKRFDTIVEEGDKAARAKLDLNSLSEVFARTGPQGSAANFKTTVGPYLEAVGINVAGLSDAQTVQSVIERMAPQQRVVGTGSQSDAEYRGFLRSLPTLMQSPGARQQVLSMLQAQNDIAVQKAQIIADHDEGNIDRKTAMQRIRALPSHETVFQKFKGENAELYLQGQRDAGARRDAGRPEDLRRVQEENQLDRWERGPDGRLRRVPR